MWYRCLLLLIMLILGTSALHGRTVIGTKKGRVRGAPVPTALGGTVDAWYSIPYAKPPVGDLRFRSPQPMDSWSDVKDTTRKPNSCFQVMDEFFGNFEGATMWNANTLMSEDCLYLSVFVPTPRVYNTSVMVWIHGEGFYVGTSTLDIYDYPTLAQEQNIVVVAMQYRLGNLGFLSFETSDAPGNSGLLDQVMALRWIKDNIAYFGGNPNDITLVGQRAGAASVALHLLSPLSRNLFNQAIMQSGSATAPWATSNLDEIVANAHKLADYVRCRDTEIANILKCLRRANATELMYNEPFKGVVNYPFVPIVDGIFLDEAPIEYLKKKHFKKCNVLLGSNSEEGYRSIMYFLPEKFQKKKGLLISRSQYESSVREMFPDKNELILQAIMFEYTDWSDPANEAMYRNALDKMIGDYYYTCNVNDFAEHYSVSDNDVYMYHFKHRSSTSKWPEWMGAIDGDEISFLFGKPLNHRSGYLSNEQQLSRQMMTYWGNFIKTG